MPAPPALTITCLSTLRPLHNNSSMLSVLICRAGKKYSAAPICGQHRQTRYHPDVSRSADPIGPASVAVYQPLYCHNQNFAIPCDNALQLRGFGDGAAAEILFQKRLDEKHGAHLSMRLIDLDDGRNVISPRHIPSARPEPITDVYRFPIMSRNATGSWSYGQIMSRRRIISPKNYCWRQWR